MGTYAGSQAQENPNAAVRQLPKPEPAARRLKCDNTKASWRWRGEEDEEVEVEA